MHARSGASQLRVRVEAVAGAELRRWLYVRTVAVAAVCRKKTNARRSGRVRNRRERGSTKGWVHRGRVHSCWEHGGAGRGRRTVAIAVDHRRELDTYRGAREYLAVLVAHQRGRVPRRSIPSCFEAASVASASAKRPSRVAEHQARRLKVPAVAAALAGVGEHRHLLRSAEKGREGYKHP